MTLGVARYRGGDWKGAAVALDRAVRLRKGGGAIEELFQQWEQAQETAESESPAG